MNSIYYKQLQKNINYIILEFRNFNSLVTPLPLNQRKLRSCVALIHAELEGYFENIGIKIIDFYSTNHLTRKQKARINQFITLYPLERFDGEKHFVQDRISSCLKVYKNTLTNRNHGIKDVNLLRILLPISYPLAEIDNAWLATMTSFGTLRGELMHQGVNQITTLVNYNYFDTNVINIIIPEIKKIDTYFFQNLRLR